MHCIEAIIYPWPFSQMCSDCEWSSSCVLDHEFGTAEEYRLCTDNCKENDGISCPNKTTKREKT